MSASRASTRCTLRSSSTSYALQGALLESGIPGEMLKALEPLRLVGLGILPSPLRKLLGVERPLRQPADFRGQRIGITESRVARETLRALGATAIAVPAGSQIGGLDGIEQQVEAIESNTYDAAAKYLTTNINLWPRPLVLFMNKAAFTALEPVQRDVLREALGNVLPETLAAVRAREQTAAAVLCRRGLKFVVATPADMSKLRDALAPRLPRARAGQRDPLLHRTDPTAAVDGVRLCQDDSVLFDR